MIFANEMLQITTKDSKLAKACAALIDETLEMIAKPKALLGKREAKISLEFVYKELDYTFSYEEIGAMCRMKLNELGYTCDRDAKNILHIFW